MDQEVKENIIFEILGTKTRVKILYYLSQISDNESNISKIIERCNANHHSTDKQLQFLTKVGLLQEKVYGRIRIFRLKTEDYRVKALKSLFDIFSNY